MYPKKNDLGERMQDIDRSYTHKMDPIKEYTESMLKIANMRRPGHWTFTKQSFTKKKYMPAFSHCWTLKSPNTISFY